MHFVVAPFCLAVGSQFVIYRGASSQSFARLVFTRGLPLLLPGVSTGCDISVCRKCSTPMGGVQPLRFPSMIAFEQGRNDEKNIFII